VPLFVSRYCRAYSLFLGFLEFEHIVNAENEVETGLQILETGGSFADGVIEYTGCNPARALRLYSCFFWQNKRLISQSKGKRSCV